MFQKGKTYVSDKVNHLMEYFRADGCGEVTELTEGPVKLNLQFFGGGGKKPGKGGRILNLGDGLNFSNRALENMGKSGRQVPIQILQDAIRYGEAMPDPRGSNAKMYYTTMYKNGKMYNLEVLYDEISNTVYHFEYARKAMGNLPAIPK